MTSRENSGNSSKNKTPRLASEISPGFGNVPPPTRETAEALWCGDRKGLLLTNGFFQFVKPEME